TATGGSWSPGGNSSSYQWRRCDTAGASCADIGGATGSSYTLVAADLANTIRVRETASKTAYNDATADSTQTVAIALGTLTNTGLPTISGTATVGNALTATGGSWTPAGTSSAYQWRQCDAAGASCTAIGGAPGTSSVLTS